MGPELLPRHSQQGPLTSGSRLEELAGRRRVSKNQRPALGGHFQDAPHGPLRLGLCSKL